MRQITEAMKVAFYGDRDFKRDNTEVRNGAIYLHGNKIAEKRVDGIWVTTAGWNTRTTFERLNGLYGCHLTQRNWVVYLNGKQWDGGWIKL
jgi:hypothetical protein